MGRAMSALRSPSSSPRWSPGRAGDRDRSSAATPSRCRGPAPRRSRRPTLVCPDVNGAPAATTSRAAVADVAGALTPPSHSTGAVDRDAAGRLEEQADRDSSAARRSPLAKRAEADRTIAVTATGSVAATPGCRPGHRDDRPAGTARCLGVRCAGAGHRLVVHRRRRPGRVHRHAPDLANPSPAAGDGRGLDVGREGPAVNTRLRRAADPRRSRRCGSRSPSVAPTSRRSRSTCTRRAGRSRPRSSTTGRRRCSPTAATSSRRPRRRAAPVVVPGFPPGRGPRYLILTAPGDLDATVNLRLVTRSGSFAPSGHQPGRRARRAFPGGRARRERWRLDRRGRAARATSRSSPGTVGHAGDRPAPRPDVARRRRPPFAGRRRSRTAESPTAGTPSSTCRRRRAPRRSG